MKDEEEARRKQELREKARQELEAWYVCVVVTPDRFWLRMIFLSLFSRESNSRTSRPVSKSVCHAFQFQSHDFLLAYFRCVSKSKCSQTVLSQLYDSLALLSLPRRHLLSPHWQWRETLAAYLK